MIINGNSQPGNSIEALYKPDKLSNSDLISHNTETLNRCQKSDNLEELDMKLGYSEIEQSQMSEIGISDQEQRSKLLCTTTEI